MPSTSGSLAVNTSTYSEAGSKPPLTQIFDELAGKPGITADEAFLSGTAAEVVPIRSVDDRELGPPGEITRRVQQTYASTVRGQVDRYKDWLEHVDG